MDIRNIGNSTALEGCKKWPAKLLRLVGAFHRENRIFVSSKKAQLDVLFEAPKIIADSFLWIFDQ